jgi:peroxiredoxin Q/BCP
MMKLKHLLTAALAVATSMFATVGYAGVSVGEVAPNFSLPGSDGNTHTLADMKGQYVVLAFFPKAFTKG